MKIPKLQNSELDELDDMIEGSSYDPVKIYEEKSVTTTSHIYLDDSFDDVSADYRDLFYKLINAKPSDKILLHLASYGGSCHVGFQVCHAVKNCRADIIIRVEQPCYSMGAVLACCGNSLLFNPETYLMFHNYSGGSHGKGAEMMMSAKEQDAWLHRSFKYFCSPLLTDIELGRIHKDGDVYVRSWDGNLKARLKRHFKSK